MACCINWRLPKSKLKQERPTPNGSAVEIMVGLVAAIRKKIGAYRGGAVVVGGRGAWGRGYRWAPGGAIAAGAAIGFIGAAGAVAYATTRPPAPGLCWYYTDPSQRNGFWDTCP